MYGDHCHVIIAQYVDFVMWKLHRNVTFFNFIIMPWLAVIERFVNV